jgi:predicted hotdog family 3-hydroxylacyl-ACP dehydratase
MTAVLQIPGPGPWFDGHFPGRPILPGVATLALIAAALDRGPVRAIGHARFRSTIAPGERLPLEARALDDHRWRVALRREGASVVTAELAFGEPEPGAAAAPVKRDPCPAPPLDVLLPHRPPMRFVTAVLDLHDDGADCAACVPADCALARGGAAPALAVLEAAAQTAAAWEALRRSRAGDASGPRQGYLVAVRDVQLHRVEVPAGAAFAVSVRLDAAAIPLTHYRAEASLDGRVVMRGLIATVLGRSDQQREPSR